MSWDDRYAAPGYLFGEEPAAFVPATLAHIPPGARILAVADGEGRNSVAWAAAGHQVTAFDISPNALAKARALAERQGVAVDFQLSGLEDWDWSLPFDAVAGVFIQFQGPAARAESFRRFDQALRPGGVLLVHGFAPRQVGYGTGGPPDAENMYTLELLRAAFPGYRVLHEADYDAEQQSGAGHRGLAALVDFIAVKP